MDEQKVLAAASAVKTFPCQGAFAIQRGNAKILRDMSIFHRARGYAGIFKY
jgi:hypothetical protein